MKTYHITLVAISVIAALLSFYWSYKAAKNHQRYKQVAKRDGEIITMLADELEFQKVYLINDDWKKHEDQIKLLDCRLKGNKRNTEETKQPEPKVYKGHNPLDWLGDLEPNK